MAYTDHPKGPGHCRHGVPTMYLCQDCVATDGMPHARERKFQSLGKKVGEIAGMDVRVHEAVPKSEALFVSHDPRQMGKITGLECQHVEGDGFTAPLFKDGGLFQPEAMPWDSRSKRELLTEIANLTRERDALRDMKPGRAAFRKQIMRLRFGDQTEAFRSLSAAKGRAISERDQARAELAKLRDIANIEAITDRVWRNLLTYLPAASPSHWRNKIRRAVADEN